MAEIVVSEFMDEDAVRSLRDTHDTIYDPALVEAPDRLIREVASCRALIVRNRTQARDPLLVAAPRLAVIGRLGVGLDNIDLTACAARGITVIPATGANADSVAEYVMTGLMLLRRPAYMATERVAAGDWPRTELMGREIKGARLGLIGFGLIAREVARRARAFGMDVLGHDPFLPMDAPVWREHGVTPRERAEILAESDAISLHVPLSEATRHMINGAALELLKPGAVLINAARGGVVEEAALAAALRAGRVAGAMLDVFEQEPLPAGSPLAGAPNLILTPHIAGITHEANTRTSWMIADGVRAALEATA